MNATWQDGAGGGPQFAFPRLTPVVKKLVILNFAIYFAMFLLSLMSEPLVYGVTDFLALNQSQWLVAPPWLPLWQVVTYGFLHSLSDPFHVLWNMLQLYFFGTMVEGIVGSRRFLWLYGACIATGALLHLLLQPLLGSSPPVVGASGGVMGILIMAAVLRPHTRVLLIFIPVTLKWLVIGLVAIDVYGLLQDLKGNGGNIAHWVHLGGAAFGFLAARKGWIWLDPIEKWQSLLVARQAEREQNDELRMDDLLDKIHREGMNSLSRREKAFLKKVSSRR